MIDLAQADRTLRTTEKSIGYYHVIDNQGVIQSSFDSQANAIRFALKDIDNCKVVKQ